MAYTLEGEYYILDSRYSLVNQYWSDEKDPRRFEYFAMNGLDDVVRHTNKAGEKYGDGRSAILKTEDIRKCGPE